MNKFEINFFSKYIGEDQEILGIIHKHFSVIFLKLFLLLSITILISFLYYQSTAIQKLLEFYILEFFLLIMYIKIIYDIFDWYNDVWIIHSDGITDLNWALFKKKTSSVDYDNIEGLGVEQGGIIDSILKKGDLVIHKIGDDNFILTDVFQPFKKTELLEALSEEAQNDNNNSDINDKFNTLIETLSGVIENFSHNNNEKLIKKEEYSKKLENIKEIDGTIDLR